MMMKELLLWLGRLCGVCGAVLCIASLAFRLHGSYLIGGFQVGTLLQAGIAGLAAGSFLLLFVLAQRR